MKTTRSYLKMLEAEKFSNRSKHISTKFHYAKGMKKKGVFQYEYCPSEAMTADLLEKPIARLSLEVF